MTRYISMRIETDTQENGKLVVVETILAFAHDDPKWKELFDDAQDWIWQEAASVEEAIAAHDAKHEQWRNDMDEGRPEKPYY